VRPGSRQTARSACLPGSIEPTGSNTAADRPHRGRTRMKNSAQATACVTSPPWPILSGGRIACRAMTTGLPRPGRQQALGRHVLVPS
jgi:hypothetical protein